MLSAAPNAAHLSLAQLLLSPAVRQRVLPNAQSVHLITQNVDGLSSRALDSVASSTDNPATVARETIIEMHGSLLRTTCTRCGDTRTNPHQPLSAEHNPIPVQELPHCAVTGCAGLLRPAVVWFGEPIPELHRIQPLVERCDLIIVLGTSNTVYPAAGFASTVKHRNEGESGRVQHRRA